MTDVIKNVTSNNQVTGSTSKSAPARPDNSDNASSVQKNESPSVASNDQVELTAAAKKLDEIVASLSSEPIVDRQKVDEIKQALADGRYEVNSASVAKKLIEIEDLLK